MAKKQRNISSGAAAIITLFVPGLGQLCQGRVISGMFLLVVVMLLYVIAGATLGAGLLLAIPAHLVAVVLAAAG
jgi:TM2 domain-containing membrane protein YozV